ncbi:hypothetical protein SAMN02745704_01566 [Paucidesulfovibrio gracilis DSM 16080]|uniref:Histidine kinase-, DNA gyrase B-, and HSP90-like ATPase n=1 Tax=Paucidesulfovibrio gracilis DSM 16080 TaxID=1121449 RepID=A0A1T4WYN8_9BACT|nr:SiaB family protein kinase [Paucidesulfovibrio gracilis]SKA82503.1 hypothetical protein SAMN02745704_01566 [Paucidesulfovibrio gracilis DSM 16080]
MTHDVLRHYEMVRQDGLILSFSGPVSQGVVEGLAELMREQMRTELTEERLVRKVFAILVEQLQNIVRYSSERVPGTGGEEEMAQGQVLVGREPDGRYFVACGNKIPRDEGQRLLERVGRMRSMDREELKALYKQMRRQGPDPESKGAGLGFIEMARKAERPLDCSVVPVDNETSFFSMKVVA